MEFVAGKIPDSHVWVEEKHETYSRYRAIGTAHSYIIGHDVQKLIELTCGPSMQDFLDMLGPADQNNTCVARPTTNPTILTVSGWGYFAPSTLKIPATYKFQGIVRHDLQGEGWGWWSKESE